MIQPAASGFRLLLPALAALASLRPAHAAAIDPVDLSSQDGTGSTLSWSAPGTTVVSSLKVPLFDVRYLGTLDPEDDEKPWLLLAARPCAACSTSETLYLVPTAAAGRKTPPRLIQLVYPGRIADPASRGTVMASRAFFGRCLKEPSDDAYVAFQKEKLDRKSRLWSSVLIAQPGEARIREKLLERRLPGLEFTLKQVKAKQCREIPGADRAVDPTSFKLKLPDDEEADDAPKENQTDEELPSPEE